MGTLTSSSLFVLIRPMDELPFKIVRMHGAKDEVIARAENFLICKAAFEKALFVYPDAHLEMRQGARIILKSKEEPPPLIPPSGAVASSPPSSVPSAAPISHWISVRFSNRCPGSFTSGCVRGLG